MTFVHIHKKYLIVFLIFISLIVAIYYFNSNSSSETGIIALEINPDETVTVVREVGTGIRINTFQEGERQPNMMDDHAYDYTVYKGIKNGKAVFERTHGFNWMGDDRHTTRTFEIYPFTLIDYADTDEKEKKIWKGIARIGTVFSGCYSEFGERILCCEWPCENSEMPEQFVNHWIKKHTKRELKDMLNQYLLDPDSNKRLLIQLGADINTTDKNGENALFHIAHKIKNGASGLDRESAYFLTKSGINLNHKNNQGKTVIDILEEDGDYFKFIPGLLCSANPNNEIFKGKCLKKCPNGYSRNTFENCIPSK